MNVFKCKMCGGTIEFEQRATVGVCEYCGTKQTLPRLDDNRRANLYDRANHFRRNNEFDKAAGIYEQILNEDKTDAEAYWSLVLCRYGIEYVEDPATRKRVPTVNRAQFTSIFDDDNYRSALQYADSLQRSLYEEEANTINEIQKGILAISQKEEPFDVFICYKETDANGRRTQDSVLANDLYHQLTQEGFKVFFSRITLEDKLGTAYEPYIFAALNSAKVMVVLGTKPENFNAVWVKNEWSRYLSIVKASNGKKVLIPAYRDMDPYDLPEEFSHLQAQDMSKLGFMQDLIRGIKKIISSDEPKLSAKETVVVTGGTDTVPLLKRAFMFLEDSDWEQADEYCEKVLDKDPENAQAYVGKLLAEQRCVSLAQFAEQRISMPVTSSISRNVDCSKDAVNEAVAKYIVPGYPRFDEAGIRSRFPSAPSYSSKTTAWEKRIQDESDFWDDNRLLSRASRYAKGDFAEELKAARNEIDAALQKGLSDSEAYDQKTEAELTEKYDAETAKVLSELEEAYKEVCLQRERDYEANCELQAKAETLPNYEYVLMRFRGAKMAGFKDCNERERQCLAEMERLRAKEKAERIAAEKAAAERAEQERIAREEQARIDEENKRIAEEKARKKRKRTIAIVTPIIIACVALVIALVTVIIPNVRYNKAETLLSQGDKLKAAIAFYNIGNYKDAKNRSMALWNANIVEERETIALGNYNTIGLKADGTVIKTAYTGQDSIRNYGQLDIDGWSDIVEVAAGTYYTIGLKADGKVLACGENYEGKLDNVQNWSDIITVSTSYFNIFGLKNDGTVVAAGSNDKGECNVGDWSDIVGISAGGYDCHTVGLKADGTVIATGFNKYGQCDVSNWKNIIAVSAGGLHTVGLKADGTVVATGDNNYGQCDVSDWEGVIAVSTGNNYTVGLKADGTVIATGYNKDGQCDVGNWSGVVAVYANYGCTLGLKADGTVIATGNNEDGQCNVDGWTDIKVPGR